MMAFEHIPQANHMAPAVVDSAEQRLAILADLAQVAKLLEHDDVIAADAASLLLDGVLSRLAREWFAVRGLDAPPMEHLLAALRQQAGDAAPFVGRLRLALRAPDPHARLVQCWELLRCINPLPDTEYSNHANSVE